MDPFSWLTAAGASGGTAGAAGTLAPLGVGSSVGAAASTAAGIASGAIVPTVAGSSLASTIGGAALSGAKLLAPVAATAALAPKPKIPAAPRPPTLDDARLKVEQADRLRAKKGGAAAILTGKLGDPSPVQTAAKTLLGA